jgi:hypothetical protein
MNCWVETTRSVSAFTTYIIQVCMVDALYGQGRAMPDDWREAARSLARWQRVERREMCASRRYRRL